MSKEFYVARTEIKEALEKVEADLVAHREQLAAFKRALTLLTEKDDPIVGEILHGAITRETAKVHKLEVELRGTKRLLEQYSLAPAIR